MESSEKHVPPAQNGPEALTGTRDSVFSRAVQEIMREDSISSIPSAKKLLLLPTGSTMSL
jgi:hypothetical protein